MRRAGYCELNGEGESRRRLSGWFDALVECLSRPSRGVQNKPPDSLKPVYPMALK